MRFSAFLLFGVSAATMPAHAQREVVDTGTYQVYQGPRALGVETFAFERHTDSLYIHSTVIQTLPTRVGEQSLEKTIQLLVKEFDNALVRYQSNQQLDGVTTIRSIIPEDTAMTVVREINEHGEARVLVRPPGKLYILDAQVFALFDVICRDLHGRKFDTRPIQLFVLGAPDTVVQATATDMGTETIRWGERPVQARKVRIADLTSEFFAWIAPRGVMLKLEQPATRLRVERKPPPVKAAGSGGQ